MASFSVPCPKTSASSSSSSSFKYLQPNPNHHHQHHLHSSISFRSNPAFLAGSSQLRGFQASSKNQHNVFRVHSQLNDVAVGKSPNSAITEKKSEESTEKSGSRNTIPDVASISAFMNQVADLVELVDSRDITELQLKQLDCELLIRKKEALPQPPAAAPSVVMQHLPPPPPAAVPMPAPAAAGPVPSPSASAPAPTAPAKPKSTHPPLKCPMAGTFYRCPAPGAPPLVKVGDKVQKGQVICIIEAMKLMNEIEADQSGTIVEILVDDAKPVSVDTPLFVIEP